MDRTYAFVDESGNSDLDTSKGGSSDFFIVCSILVAEKDLDAAYVQAEALRSRKELPDRIALYSQHASHLSDGILKTVPVAALPRALRGARLEDDLGI